MHTKACLLAKGYLDSYGTVLFIDNLGFLAVMTYKQIQMTDDYRIINRNG